MATYKESKDNPLHRDFGTWSNTRFVLGKAKKYCPAVFPLALCDLLCGSLQGYYWGIIGKFVIDAIVAKAAFERLFWILMLGFLGALLIWSGKVVAGSMVWPRYIHVRSGVIHERVEKALRMDYELLETPAALDIQQRGQKATDGNDIGFEGMMHLMQDLGKNLVTAVVTFVSVTVLDARLIAAISFLSVASFLVYRKILKKDKTEVWDELASIWRRSSYLARISQHFDFAKDIRLFDMRRFLLKKQRGVFEIREERMDHHQNLWNWNMLFGQAMNFISRALIYAVLYFAVLHRTHPLSIGNFTLYLSLAVAFSEALLTLLQRFGDYTRASLEVDDLRSFLELKSKDREECQAIPKADDWEIGFHNVSYRYPEAEKNAVEQLSFTLRAGEKLAVVGLNGAGKTTMIKLMLRLYEPTEGTITLNGVDIRRYRREEYYRLFSPAFQNVELFAVSLAENVSMSPPNATDRGRVETSLRDAGLGDKLDSLPKGIDTQLTKIADEEGIDLSGGEKQKLALARALYKDAPIIVLDEPTAALDALAEKHLYERFDRLIGKKSAVYISHRLASTRFCDAIAMFRDGRIVEYGTHEELMARAGEYARLFGVQAQYYREHPEGEEAEA